MSEPKSTQAPLQFVYPKLQSMSQPLGPQTALPFGVAPQLVPQVLQLVVSSSFRQAPLQRLKPGSQTMPHPLASHLAEPSTTVGHALSQPRQCAGSWLVSKHEPPQFSVPGGQLLTHMPEEHT